MPSIKQGDPFSKKKEKKTLVEQRVSWIERAVGFLEQLECMFLDVAKMRESVSRAVQYSGEKYLAGATLAPKA